MLVLDDFAIGPLTEEARRDLLELLVRARHRHRMCVAPSDVAPRTRGRERPRRRIRETAERESLRCR